MGSVSRGDKAALTPSLRAPAEQGVMSSRQSGEASEKAGSW